jgi:hypothetical protein
MQKYLVWAAVTVTLLAFSASCGGDDEFSSGDPLVDAFAAQLALDSQSGAFLALDRADTACFAASAFDAIGDQRQTELGFTLDNIPLLYQADWTDTEIDALTEALDTCVDDPATGTEAFIAPALPRSGDYNDCVVAGITTAFGDRYWLEQFPSFFTPPRIEMIAEDVSGPPPWVTALEPIFETCVPGYGEPPNTEDACGGQPCEDEPDPGDLRTVVLECSRDPYFDTSFYAGVDDLYETLRFTLNCEGHGLGTLISARLLAFPCLQGLRDIEMSVTGETITEQALTDACANAP